MAHNGSGVAGYISKRAHSSRAYVRTGLTAGPAGLALDVSTPPAVTYATQAGSATTAAFSPPAASVLFVLMAVATVSSQTNSLTSVTNTGTALTWARLRNDIGANRGGVDVWWAYNANAQSGITVTGNLSFLSQNVTAPTGLLRVLVFTNAKATQTGASTIRNSGASSAWSLNVTTTAANSWVWAVVENYASTTLPTPGAGQSIDAQVAAAGVGGAFWTQSQTATTPGSGTVVTMGDTAPNITGNVVAFEVLRA